MHQKIRRKYDARRQQSGKGDEDNAGNSKCPATFSHTGENSSFCGLKCRLLA